MSDLNQLNPQPLPPAPADRVRVYVNGDISYDLKAMNKVVANVLGKLGCGHCHSGRILEFIDIREYVINPKTLEPQIGVGAGF